MNAPVDKTPPMPETFDFSELEGIMTEEEIAALAAGDDPVTVIPDGEPKKPADDGLLADDAATIAAAEAAQQAALAAQTPATPDAEPAKPAPVEIPDTTQARAAIEAFDATIEAIQQKYDDGELSAAEMRKQVSDASKAQAEAMSLVSQAETLIVQQQKAAEAIWLGNLDQFKAAGNEVLWSDAHVKGFDAALRTVTDSAKSPQFAGKPFEVQIRAAARIYAAQHEALTGEALPIAEVAPKASVPKAGAKAEAMKTPRPDAPQTLAGLNGDGGLSMNDGSFASIDRLAATDPIAAETALAQMSPEQRDLYLRTAG